MLFILSPIKSVRNNVFVKVCKTFKYRVNDYKSNKSKEATGELCMQEHLFKKFYDSKHSDVLSDISITFTDKVFI